MNYIVFDLEFNQKYKNAEEEVTKEVSIEKDEEAELKRNLTFEIIQIGAIKLNENFEKISTFNSLVKPVIHKTLHPYVETMTKININEADEAEKFPKVYENFLNFIGEEPGIFCVWGYVDIKELLSNINYYGLPTKDLPKKYIDVQLHASKLLNYSKGTRVGLKTALELLAIKDDGDFHDALMDALYTSLIFKNIYNKAMKPLDFSTSSNNLRRSKASVPKLKVDNNALIKQFEKMYKRSMTEEEIAIIKTAYTMGKTQQFLIPKDKNS